jgi:hypothetical protein
MLGDCNATVGELGERLRILKRDFRTTLTFERMVGDLHGELAAIVSRSDLDSEEPVEAK